MLSPGENLALAIGLTLVLALIMLGVYLFTIDARFVVCERGVIMGRLIPGLPLSPTYVIAGREIDPRTVAVVSSGATAARELGMPFFFFQYKTFPGAVGVRALDIASCALAAPCGRRCSSSPTAEPMPSPMPSCT